ncbi:MAG: phosphoglycerate dehydrogenase [Rhodospirillales bacterium]|jgi:phosphoglycerate dehydrogenase-like enzyme|nr:phosphoglycerate dehydrogenase [Rhodospirillales bacterium]HJO97618.1 phosphoglycerate dehydrogenase [Rhodospirillales bacterium]
MNDTKKVLVTLHLLNGHAQPSFERLRQAGFEVAFNTLDRRLGEDELVDALSGVFATIAGVEAYSERVLASAPDLRLISRWGVGYDSIDVDAATRHGVAVALAFGTNHEAVADHAFAFMSGLASDVAATHRIIDGGGWRSDFRAPFSGATVGIVGLGRIGRAVARRCRAFDMHVLANDIDPAAIEYGTGQGYEMVALDDLLRRSDFVTLHVPLTEITDGMMNETRLSAMKPTAYLINTARGGLVDEAALFDALSGRHLAGAGLDVFANEPPKGSPLLGLENVLFSPHSATINDTSERLVTERCIDTVLAVADGKDPGQGLVVNTAALASLNAHQDV